MAKRPHCELPTVVGRPDEIDVPTETDDQIEAMLAITKYEKAISPDQQHAAWAYVQRIAAAPLSGPDRDTADAIIRSTYERLMTLSRSPAKYVYPIYAGGLGEVMMERDKVPVTLGPRSARLEQQYTYFRSRLYPDGEPDYGQIPEKVSQP